MIKNIQKLGFHHKCKTLSMGDYTHSFRQYIMGRITVGKKCIVVLVLYNLPRNFNDPEQKCNDSNNGTIKLVHEAAKLHFTQKIKH